MHANAAGETEIKKSSCGDAMVTLTPCVCDDLIDIVAHCSFWSCNVKYISRNGVRLVLRLKSLCRNSMHVCVGKAIRLSNLGIYAPLCSCRVTQSKTVRNLPFSKGRTFRSPSPDSRPMATRFRLVLVLVSVPLETKIEAGQHH
jgi:hypothetical protein